MQSTRLLPMTWTRGPSGVYQSQSDGGRYSLYPTGGDCYVVEVSGRRQRIVATLPEVQAWCDAHRQSLADKNG